MRITGSGARNAVSTANIDKQIENLEKRKEALQKTMSNAKDPKTQESLGKQLQLIEVQIMALRAQKEAARSNVAPVSGEESSEATEKSDSFDAETVNAKNANKTLEERPERIGKEPGLYALERDRNGDLKISYELKDKENPKRENEEERFAQGSH